MMMIGKYEIQEEIGRGGFAVVYHARHSMLQSEAAVKVLHTALAGDAGERERFLRDGRSASGLEHTHIVKIQRLIEEGENVAIAMDYFPSGDLRKRIQQRGSLTAEEALRIISQVSDALDYAHANGVIHRDVKPSNILLDPAGNAYLSDFGLVRKSGDSRLTQIGRMVGTSTYVSPEQAQDFPGLDGRSDQYSLAVTAFELLVGAPPFEADNSTAVAVMHLTQPPPIASERNHDIPVEIDGVLNRALSKDPASRYATCMVFAQELSAAWIAGQAHLARGLLEEAESLLSAGGLDEALRKLTMARKLVQGRPELQSLLIRLEETRQISELVEQTKQAWENARLKAQAVLEIFPEYPDPQGLFVTLGLRAQRRHLPSTVEMIRQGGVGLLLGGFLGGVILYLFFLVITRGNNP